ncbi:MAG TPA: response regulator transcription factor [Solirubrobacteraceae bacterium]|nr:response regulator transcription factor [Solirubrobacteraceae bacterium]
MSDAQSQQTSSSGPVAVALAESDPARRVAIGALIRQSRHLDLVATLRDDEATLEWLATGGPADVLMSSSTIRVHRAERYELLARVRELRPNLPIVFAMETELPGAVRRAYNQTDLSLVSVRDELARVHEALLTAATGRRYISPRLRSVLDADTLTERQVEILDRIARGEGRPEIARALGVSESTVRSHTKELYKRLGVNERAHAVAVALRDRIIMAPPRTEAERRAGRAGLDA